MNARSIAFAATALAALSASAIAADDKMASDKMASMEKCYGVSLAGKNDCAAGAGHDLRWHVEGRLRRQPLQKRRQGHLHLDQDAQGHGLADADEGVMSS